MAKSMRNGSPGPVGITQQHFYDPNECDGDPSSLYPLLSIHYVFRSCDLLSRGTVFPFMFILLSLCIFNAYTRLYGTMPT